MVTQYLPFDVEDDVLTIESISYVMERKIFHECLLKFGMTTDSILSKLNIALKEADETTYWLDLLHVCNYLNDESFNSLNKDCREIIGLLTSIIKKLKQSTI